MRNLQATAAAIVATLVALAVACGDDSPDLDATVEAQVTAKLDEQTAIDASVQATKEAILTLTPTPTRTPTLTPTTTLPNSSTPTPTPAQSPTSTATPSPLPSLTVTPTSEPTATQTTEQNSAAPIGLTKYLSGDFTDSDGDGMTDVAENKYGFDPLDASSFPQEPELAANYYSEFGIRLSTREFPEPSSIGDSSNRISYTFSNNFPEEAESQYREFLKRVFPILYKYLGPPAETLNVSIENAGDDSDFIEITDKGRTLLTDTSFIPRLIVHEMAHAWKGRYVIATDEDWEIDTALSGFEEGTAEGMAFEIVHEYVRSYPNDPATLQLLEERSAQYWSSGTTIYDAIKNLRWTGAGDFWNPPSGAENRYSIAATTVQMMVRENPNFMKEFMSLYYETIREDPDWRPNRKDMVNLWETVVPELNGYRLSEHLDTLPVFNGRELDEGAYVMQALRSYGEFGDQLFALAYAISGGKLWNMSDEDLKDVPDWISTSPGENGLHYIDTQRSPFFVEVTDAYGQEYATYDFKTEWDRYPDGSPAGFGWSYAEELEMDNFPIGLYQGTVTFTDYVEHDEGARDSYYFFGLEDFEQDRESEYVIMIGIDGVAEGRAEITIGGKAHTAPISNGVAVFRSSKWRFDMQGRLPITITNDESVSRSYYRTLIEAGTIHDYYQHQFIIVDTDFDGIEDQFE
ncbi:MAG: hypothetical protein OXD46_07350 [Chloroflexi bacterium]|nr:hypothetical protein [Chloroflexota bacterium]